MSSSQRLPAIPNVQSPVPDDVRRFFDAVSANIQALTAQNTNASGLDAAITFRDITQATGATVTVTQGPQPNRKPVLNFALQGQKPGSTVVLTSAWAGIDKTGSNLTDILTRNHNDLQTVQGGATGERYHLSVAEVGKLAGIQAGAQVNNISDINAAALVGGADTALHFHSADRAWANITGKPTSITGYGITLTSADVTGALTFTPYNATNPSGYQTAAQVSAAIAAAAYTLPTASTTVLGGVKIDGTTITIAAGVISATAPAFSAITGKPTTLAGYGITDAAPSSHVGSGGSAHAVFTSTVAGFVGASGGGTANFLRADGTWAVDTSREATANKGAANGYCPLDAAAKVPVANLPAAVLGAMNYQGTWNASTNTPALTSGVGTKGFYYVVNVAGSTNLDGNAVWTVNDIAVYNGTAWNIIQGGLTSAEIIAALGFTPENAANKDASGGYVGKTLEKINFYNAARTFVSFLTNANTAARTYTFPDYDATMATLAGAETLSGKTFVAPALGTPASGTLTNCTGLPYSGLTGTVPTWNQNTTGNAATATALQTARLISGNSFNGSADITIIGTPINGGGQVYNAYPVSTDLNLCIHAGDYNFADTYTNKPTGVTSWGFLHTSRHLNLSSGSVYTHQTAYDMNGANAGAMYTRRGVPSAGFTCTWSPWLKVITDDGAGSVSLAGTLSAVYGADNTTGDPITGMAGRFVGSVGGTQSGVIQIESNDAIGAGYGGSISFGGRYQGTQFASWARIVGYKVNATAGDYGGGLQFWVRANGAPSYLGAVLDQTARLYLTGGLSAGDNSNVGSAVPFSGGGRYFDVYNTGAAAASSAIIRLITQVSNGSTTYSTDFVRYKNGSFLINHADPAGSINIGLNSVVNLSISTGGTVSTSGAFVAGTTLGFGTGGTWAAGTIYSDSNYGCIVRAKQASPAVAEFMFANSAGTALASISTAGIVAATRFDSATIPLFVNSTSCRASVETYSNTTAAANTVYDTGLSASLSYRSSGVVRVSYCGASGTAASRSLTYFAAGYFSKMGANASGPCSRFANGTDVGPGTFNGYVSIYHPTAGNPIQVLMSIGTNGNLLFQANVAGSYYVEFLWD